MDSQQRTPPPLWFWGIAVVALLWNLIGVGIFLAEIFAQEAMLEGMTDAQKTWVRNTPSWIYFVFGLSVATGLGGAVALLLRRNIAIPLFAISCLAVLVQMGYTMIVAGGLQVMGPSGVIMPALVVGLSTIWLIFSVFSQGRGWLILSRSISDE